MINKWTDNDRSFSSQWSDRRVAFIWICIVVIVFIFMGNIAFMTVKTNAQDTVRNQQEITALVDCAKQTTKSPADCRALIYGTR